MSSPVRVLGSVPPASKATNPQKRVLTDSEDTEERDPKRARSQEALGDQNGHRDAKDKKKRRKKRRKVSVVQTHDSSDAETPAVASKHSLARVRSRSVASVGPDTVSVAHTTDKTKKETRQASAGPSSLPSARPKSPSRDSERRTLTISPTVRYKDILWIMH